MLVKFTKDLTLSVGGMTVKSFKKNDQFDLPDDQAERHIAKGTVVKVAPIAELKADKAPIENKADEPVAATKTTSKKRK